MRCHTGDVVMWDVVMTAHLVALFVIIIVVMVVMINEPGKI